MIPAIELVKKDLDKSNTFKSLFEQPKAPLSKFNSVSSVIRKLSNCNNCYIRKWCQKYETMTERQRTVGCSDLREIWKFELRKYSDPIDYVIIDELARIDMLTRLQELEDGANGKTASLQMMRLKILKEKYLELVLKHYKPRKVEVQHKFEFGDGKLKVDVEAYDDGRADGHRGLSPASKGERLEVVEDDTQQEETN